jgi:hypothetical protein
MGAMRLSTRSAILAYELHTVRRHFSFIAYLFEHADRELHDAIRVSYLESLFIGEAAAGYEHARGLLPKNLAETLKKLEMRHALLQSLPGRLQRGRQDRRFQLTFPGANVARCGPAPAGLWPRVCCIR